jgi:hypothetical protein
MRKYIFLITTCLLAVNCPVFAKSSKSKKTPSAHSVHTKNGQPIRSKKSGEIVDLKRKRKAK